MLIFAIYAKGKIIFVNQNKDFFPMSKSIINQVY
jgi:hypothetical protein